ncbi:MAG: hypothetical protein WC764_04755 [Candidatus Paceibacterota bacterium]
MQLAPTAYRTRAYLKNKLGAENRLVSFMQVDTACTVDTDEEAGAASEVYGRVTDDTKKWGD